MKEEISNYTLGMLQRLNKKMLMHDNRLFAINSFEFIREKKVSKGSWFSKKHYEEVIYLTKLEISSYHSEGKFLSTLTDDGALHIIRWYNLYYFKEEWESFKNQLNAFGFEIKKIEQPKENQS